MLLVTLFLAATTINYVSSHGFYNIAHMANTPLSVDWALGKGANAVEVDLEFSTSTGAPMRFIHSPNGEACDCTCMCPTGVGCDLFFPNSICPVLKGDPSVKLAACSAASGVTALLNHMAKKSNLALIVVDSKIDGTKMSANVQAQAAVYIVKALEDQLFKKGYKGNVIVGGPKFDSLPYVKKVSQITHASPYHKQTFISIDMEDNNIGGVINRLKSAYPANQNVVFGTGVSACAPSPITKQTHKLSAINSAKGAVGMTYTWTLDKDSSLSEAIQYYDGIMTNYPGALHDILKEKNIKLAQPGDLIKPSTRSAITSMSGRACDCDYSKGGCTVSRLPPSGMGCKCSYKGAWTCGGDVVKCLNPDSAYCKSPQKSALTCIQGGGDCQGYRSESCDCDYNIAGGCKIKRPVNSGSACRCYMAGAWTCGGEVVKCRNPGSAECNSPNQSVYSCIEGGGDCGGYPACDCDYHPGGCSISKAAPANTACKCRYKGAWTCKGSLVHCSDPNSSNCKRPDRSVQSCVEGGGDCMGYNSHDCDCDYKSGGCVISKVPPRRTACKCNYKGFWTCGGHVVQCPVYNNYYCQNPDSSRNTCLQGRGDCGGY